MLHHGKLGPEEGKALEDAQWRHRGGSLVLDNTAAFNPRPPTRSRTRDSRRSLGVRECAVDQRVQAGLQAGDDQLRALVSDPAGGNRLGESRLDCGLDRLFEARDGLALRSRNLSQRLAGTKLRS
jgi:hypothetical protein